MLKNKYSIDTNKIVWRNIDGEAVILNLDSGFYYSLNKVGTLIWQMISEKKSTPEIINMFEKEFRISKSKIGSDLSALLRDFQKERLVEAVK